MPKWIYDCMPCNIDEKIISSSIKDYFSFNGKIIDRDYFSFNAGRDKCCKWKKFKARHRDIVFQVRGSSGDQFFNRWIRVEACVYFRIIKKYREKVKYFEEREREYEIEKNNDEKEYLICLTELKKKGIKTAGNNILIDGISVNCEDYMKLKRLNLLDKKYIVSKPKDDEAGIQSVLSSPDDCAIIEQNSIIKAKERVLESKIIDADVEKWNKKMEKEKKRVDDWNFDELRIKEEKFNISREWK